MDIKQIVGIHLKYARYQSGLSQEKFYEKYGLSSKYFSNIERGKINIGIEMLQLISKVFEIPINELVLYDEKKVIHKKRIDEKIKA